MNHSFTLLRYRYFRKYGRSFLSVVMFTILLFSSASCGFDPGDPAGIGSAVDKAINEIERTRQTIDGISGEWRGELPKLVDDLSGIESQASGDMRSIMTDTVNQVQDLATQTINLTAARANEVLGNTNAFVLCDASFVKEGVREQLIYLVDNLKFWKQTKQHLDQKPNHHVCVINPSALALNPSGNQWIINTSNMPLPNIVQVYGYNFRPDALPNFELFDANGTKLSDINVHAAYVTHYQINLDFSGEKFQGAQSGVRIVFNWPDQTDPNTINLIMNVPAKLKLSNPIFTPSVPVIQRDTVSLQLTITNIGGSRSGNFVITWKPDPNDNQVYTSSQLPLEAGESRTVYILGPVYQGPEYGNIESLINIDNGDDILRVMVIVQPPKIVLRPDLNTDRFIGGLIDGAFYFTVSCPADYVVTGLFGEYRSYIEALGIRCSPLDQWGRIGTSVSFSKPAGAPGFGGNRFELMCEFPKAVVGISGHASAVVDQIAVHCAGLTDPRTNLPLSGQNAVGGGGGTVFGPIVCDDNSVMTGFKGGNNLYNDYHAMTQLYIICTPFIKQ